MKYSGVRVPDYRIKFWSKSLIRDQIIIMVVKFEEAYFPISGFYAPKSLV